jgi:hypothetical protein
MINPFPWKNPIIIIILYIDVVVYNNLNTA